MPKYEHQISQYEKYMPKETFQKMDDIQASIIGYRRRMESLKKKHGRDNPQIDFRIKQYTQRIYDLEEDILRYKLQFDCSEQKYKDKQAIQKFHRLKKKFNEQKDMKNEELQFLYNYCVSNGKKRWSDIIRSEIDKQNQLE